MKIGGRSWMWAEQGGRWRRTHCIKPGVIINWYAVHLEKVFCHVSNALFLTWNTDRCCTMTWHVLFLSQHHSRGDIVQWIGGQTAIQTNVLFLCVCGVWMAKWTTVREEKSQNCKTFDFNWGQLNETGSHENTCEIPPPLCSLSVCVTQSD